MIIDKENMFKAALMSGINIFAGAGFSTLPDPNGKYLPVASELCTEICSHYGINPSYKDDLEKLAGILQTRFDQQFQEFLRNKYTVSSYNPKYDYLNNIKIHAFITTNIDNLIQCVFDKSTNYYLHDITNYGANKTGHSQIPFIPLHGNVKNLESRLYFGKNELTDVDEKNRELFSTMETKLREAPTLFLGYGFHDSSVMRKISFLLTNRCHEVWILCRPGDGNIEYFRDLGCFVIEGNTEELLDWINTNCDTAQASTTTNQIQGILSMYQIPTVNSVETVSAESYYAYGETSWYAILNAYPVERSIISELYNCALGDNNIIAVGISFSGKTTAMMQLALKYNTNDIKLVLCRAVTVEEATTLINTIGNQKAVVFIDNCCDNVDACQLFMKKSNIRTIGFTSDYTYEMTKHKLSGMHYNVVYIDELDNADAQKIYEAIPQHIRKAKYVPRPQSFEKYSMIEFLESNVSRFVSAQRISSILMNIKKKSRVCFETIAIAAYLVANRSLLNTDVMYSYFGLSDYNQMKTIIEQTERYLNSYDSNGFHQEDQDYYSLRSSIFASLALDALTKNFKTDFSRCVRRFIEQVSRYRIFDYYIFKRHAFDARFFKNLFGATANDLYKKINQSDGNEYTLQQWALYKSYTGDLPGAYATIDEAINKAPYNFSIRNSRAIILFESNKEFDNRTAEENRLEAMEILRQCYQSDKRKVYHAQKFAEFAIYLAENYDNVNYIEDAREWIEDIYETFESRSATTKRLLDRLNNWGC